MPGNTEVVDYGQSGQRLYGVLRSRSSNSYWNTAAQGMVPYADTSWGNFAVLMAETGTAGIYLFQAPALLPPDDYDLLMRVAATPSSAPALSDSQAASVGEHWDGTLLTPLATGGTIYGTTGTLAVTVTEIDPNGQPIPNVVVWISQDQAGTLKTPSEVTDAFGQARFRLDPQNAWLWRSHADWVWTPNPQAVTISAAAVLTRRVNATVKTDAR